MSACDQKISGFGMLNNGKLKMNQRMPKNADLLKKISLMGTEVIVLLMTCLRTLQQL